MNRQPESLASMNHTMTSLILYMGDFGLYAAVVGFAVMLLMPDRTGHPIGARIAVLGGVAMAYEMLLAQMG